MARHTDDSGSSSGQGSENPSSLIRNASLEVGIIIKRDIMYG